MEKQMLSVKGGGQRGIRTLGTLSRTHAFQACALNHSATCPCLDPPRFSRRCGEIAFAEIPLVLRHRLKKRRWQAGRIYTDQIERINCFLPKKLRLVTA